MKNITFDELVEKQNDGKKMVVDFYADWCQPCKVLTPILETISLEHNLVEFVKVDAGRYHDILKELNIRAVPTVIMFDGKKEVGRFTGLQPERKINLMILESYTSYE